MASVLVEVFVEDSNDHSPVFAAKWTRQGPLPIAQDTAVGTVLLKVGEFYEFDKFHRILIELKNALSF